MHIHISALELVITGLYVVIWSFLWRTLAAFFARSNNGSVATVGKAMSVVL